MNSSRHFKSNFFTNPVSGGQRFCDKSPVFAVMSPVFLTQLLLVVPNRISAPARLQQLPDLPRLVPNSPIGR